MSRIVAGVVAANVAAPVLLLLAAFLRPASTTLSWEDNLTVIAIILVMTWAVMSVTVLPVSLVLALIAHMEGWRAAWIPLLVGAALGAVSHYWLLQWVFGPSEDGWLLTATYALIGALCGWIYWHIAVRGQPGGPVL